MKKSFLFPRLSVLAAFLFACQSGPTKTKTPEPFNPVCYTSVSETDTAWLSIDTNKKIVNGNLKFNYAAKKEIYDGQFKGEFYGDTLRGHYDFKINNAERWNRNPVAFLKKDGKLIMGVGKFMLIMGSAHFDNLVPIDYDKGRFIFEATPCKEK